VIPSSLATVIAFLVLVAPGILYESLNERRRPAYSTSAFREASRVALASVVFSGAALIVLAVLRAVRPDLMPDPRELIADPRGYAQNHYQLIAVAVLAEFAIALALASAWAWGWNRYGSRGQSSAAIKPISAWFKVFREDAKDSYPYLRVRLSTGTVYEGVIADYVPDFVGPAERELVLSPPLYVRVGDEPRRQVTGYKRLIIPGSSIVTISVKYIDREAYDDWARSRKTSDGYMPKGASMTSSTGVSEVKELLARGDGLERPC
jgi:Family of unknown function (DUF6338)